MSDAMGCDLGCCSAEVAALPDGGWTQTEKGYVLDPRRREHVARVRAAAFAEIDRKQAHYPQCVVCGQRARKLDEARTCSRITAVHVQHRQESASRNAVFR